MKQDILDFVRLLFNKKFTVFLLSYYDLKKRYLGSFLGFSWAFVQPLVMTVILWLIMGILLAAQNVKGIPFFVWLLTGMVVWTFISDAINSSAGVFREYVFLVKKIQFKYVILPFIKVFSSLIVHFIFLLLLFIVFSIKGIRPNVNWFWIVYYILGSILLLTGIGLLVSSMSVLFPDLPHIISILLQFGFWLTPIFWTPEMLPQGAISSSIIKWLIILNPIAYIVEGYRNVFLCGLSLCSNTVGMLFFWSITLISLFVGMLTFSKLKIHFADML